MLDHLVRLGSGDRIANWHLASACRKFGHVLGPDSLQREGLAQLTAVGDLGDEAIAPEAGQRGGVGLPRPLLGHQRRRVGVHRRREQVRAVGGERGQRLRVEPLGVLVQHNSPQAELGALLQKRREVAGGDAVVGLDLVEEDPEGLSLAARDLRAPLPRVKQVEEQQVGDQPLVDVARSGVGEDDQPLVHRLARPVGALALAEQGGDRGRVTQAVDEVGDRRDRLFGESREALGPKRLRRGGQEREDGVAPALTGEQWQQLEDRRAQLRWQYAGHVGERPRRLRGSG